MKKNKTLHKYILSLFPIILLSFYSLVFGGNLPELLSLEDCIKIVDNQSLAIKGAELDEEAAQEDIYGAWSAYMPTLTFSYSVTDLHSRANNDWDYPNDNNTLDAEQTGQNAKVKSTVEDNSVADDLYLDQFSKNFSAKVTQPIFTGVKELADIKTADLNKDYATLQKEMMVNREYLKVRSIFFTWLGAKKRFLKWNESIDRLETQTEIANAWVQKRLAPKLRLMEINVEMSNAKHEQLRAKNEMDTAKSKLKEILSLSTDEEIDVEGEFLSDSSFPCDILEQCIDRGLSQRKDIHLIIKNIQMEKSRIVSTESRNLPKAYLDLSYVDYQRDYEDSSLTDDYRDYYSVSVNFSFTPFQSGKTLFEVRKRRIGIKRLKMQLKQQKNSIVAEVSENYNTLQDSTNAVSNSLLRLEEAQSAYAVAKRSLELGVSGLNDMLDAEKRLIDSEIAMINSEMVKTLSFWRLWYAIGNK